MPDRRAPLAAPFPPEALRWRAVEIATAERRALMEPELDQAAVITRLDEVLGSEGWSQRYLVFGAEAIICELEIDGVCKAGVAARHTPRDDAERLAAAALAKAAERFGLAPPVAAGVRYWVDADPESGEPLHDPVPAAAAATAAKPEGQLVIDRLVERLREEGLGLEAAKLLVAYGGYGQDPATARDLYARLRALLLRRNPGASLESQP